MEKKLKNIAIIAHVDHGKTTLVDTLFKQSGIFKDHEKTEERSMDSNSIEKERGITILAKCTSIDWKDYTINILDTPGHSDFGSEVERVLIMADCVLLVVDAVEGVMPQTKFVVTKALENHLKLIIFINKIDRVNADSLKELKETTDKAMEEVLELIFNVTTNSEKQLTSTDQALESPIFYGSGRSGFASSSLEKAWKKEVNNISEILDKIIDYCPAPKTTGDNLQLLVSMIDLDEYFGKLLIGKIFGGSLKIGQTVLSINQDNQKKESFRVNKIFGFKGTSRVEKEFAEAGDIVCIAGASITSVGDMIATSMETELLPTPKIDPPTLSVVITANNSPLAGRDGTQLTIRKIKDRLLRESETNVGINVEEQGDAVLVKGRGELQLSVLMEQMRREGFEFMVHAPQILIKEEGGKKLEPQERVMIDVAQEYTSAIINKIGLRGGELLDMIEFSDRVRLIFKIPARFLLGYFTEFMTDTKGTGLLNKEFDGYIPYKGERKSRSCGVLVSTDSGKITSYALDKLLDRGMFFVGPDTETYKGMIVGEHNKANDLHINVTRGKQLTNVRASGKDDLIKLPPPVIVTIEKAITYIKEGEKVEITPTRICLVQ